MNEQPKGGLMSNSTIAICPVCKAFTKAAQTDKLSSQSKEEFFELWQEGFVLQTETQEETKAREYSPYSVCIKHIKSQENELSS